MRFLLPFWLPIVFTVTSELLAADLSSRFAVHIRKATYHHMLRYAPEPQRSWLLD